MQVIDNFLDHVSFHNIQQAFFSFDCKWEWSEIVEKDELMDISQVDNYQFVHGLHGGAMPQSRLFEYMLPVLDKLNVAAIIKIKANLTTKTPSIVKHGYHVDQNFPHSKTAIFYLNTCDGYTSFENEGIVESVENRVVIFDSNKKHTGTSLTNDSRRIVININYFSAGDEMGIIKSASTVRENNINN